MKPLSFPFDAATLTSTVFSLARAYFKDFQDPRTGILYGARLRTKARWTSPQDVKAGKPRPWGYGSHIEDTALHCGHTLVALLDAYAARPDPFLKREAKRLFRALKRIGSVSPVPGLVPRGPHPDDPTAFYDDSSMDQNTTFIISLARYANSPLATAQEKEWIRWKLQRVGERLEKYGWSIRRADGVTQAHVGFSWLGFNSNHASILLPAVLALYKGTGDPHWLEAYERFSTEKGGRRWKVLRPGPHVRINAHPIYANQTAFRLNALYHFETDPERKRQIFDLLEYVAKLQLARDFPGPFYRRFHRAEEFEQARKQFGWDDAELHGALDAWRKFKPAFLDQRSPLAALAHVRFPLGGFHMVLLSERRGLIAQYLPDIWKMLTTVDLKKISTGETNYLFTVVALHLYAFYFNETAASPARDRYGKELPILRDAGVGPCMDVCVEGKFAYAIGRGKLHVLDISDPARPRPVGELAGLGNVRQIVARRGVAYVTAREDGLFVIDVHDPASPKLLRHYDTIEFATGVAISGDVLFVACRNYGVELIDVTRPAAPRHLSVVRTGEAQSVVARNGYLYAGVWGTSEVVTVDARNPRRPRITARNPLDGYGDGVDVRAGRLYVATGHHSRLPHRQPGDPGFGRGHGLEIFSLADPARPEFLGRIKTPALYQIGMDMWSVAAAGKYAFLADTYNGVFVIDVSDPARPRCVAHRRLPVVKSKKLPSPVAGLALAKDVIYAAGAWSDLHVVAAPGLARRPRAERDEPPAIPPARASRPKGCRVYRPEGQVHAVDFVGDLAVVACGADGLHLVRLWPRIERLAAHPTEGFAVDVRVSNGRVFVAESAGGLSIWCVGDAGELTLEGRYRPRRRPVKQVVVPPPGKYALLQVGSTYLHIVDVSDPARPKLALSDKRRGLLYYDQIMDGLVSGRYACAFWHVTGLYWYDLYGGPRPRYTGDNYRQRIGSANGLAAFGDKTLAVCRGGYALIERSERRPLNALEIRRAPGCRLIGKPSICGRRLYVSNRPTGKVWVVDVSDIERPKLLRSLATPGNPGRVVEHRNAIIVPDGYEGLRVYDAAW